MVLLTWNGLQCQRKARFKKHKYSQKRSFVGQQTSISYTVFFKSPRNPKINKRSEVGFVARVFVCKGSLICEMSRRITTDFKIETQRPHSFFFLFSGKQKTVRLVGSGWVSLLSNTVADERFKSRISRTDFGTKNDLFSVQWKATQSFRAMTQMNVCFDY